MRSGSFTRLGMVIPPSDTGRPRGRGTLGGGPSGLRPPAGSPARSPAEAGSPADAVSPAGTVSRVGAVSRVGGRPPADRPPPAGPTGPGWDDVETAVSAIRARYGHASIGPATLVSDSGLAVKGRGDTQWGPSSVQPPDAPPP